MWYLQCIFLMLCYSCQTHYTTPYSGMYADLEPRENPPDCYFGIDPMADLNIMKILLIVTTEMTPRQRLSKLKVAVAVTQVAHQPISQLKYFNDYNQKTVSFLDSVL